MTHYTPYTDHSFRLKYLSLIILLSFTFLGNMGWGQVRNRSSNFKIGPVIYDLTGTVSVEHNNNILSAPKPLAISDIIISPGINFNGKWKFSRANTIQLSFYTQYQFYLYHPELGTNNTFPLIAPNSEISFQMKMGAFRVTPFFAFSFNTDSTNVPDQNGNSSNSVYGRFNLSEGVRVLWNLNRKTKPYLNIFRSDTIPFKSPTFEYTASHLYTINPGFNYDMASNLQLGLDFQATMNKYKTDFQNASKNYVLGPTMNWSISSNMNLIASASYTLYHFDNAGNNGDFSQSRGLQWQMTFLHFLRPDLQYRVFTSQNFSYGYIANTTKTRTLGAAGQWQALKKTTFRVAIVHQKGEDSGGIAAETYTQNTGGIGLDYALNARTAFSFDYEISKKESDLGSRSFNQQRYIAALSYDF